MAEVRTGYKPPVWLIVAVCFFGVFLQAPELIGIGDIAKNLPVFLGLSGFWAHMLESTFFTITGFLIVIVFFYLTERHTLRMIGNWKLWITLLIITALSGLLLGKKVVDVHGVQISYDGLSVGVDIMARASIFMCLIMSVSQRISPDMMVRAFARIGIPQAGGAMALGVKILPQMVSHWKTDMKKSRGQGITARIARIIASADELAEEIGKDVKIWMAPRKDTKIFTVTGPSGSGKSSLLHKLLREAEKAEISCSGIYQPSVFEDDKRIGYDVELIPDSERLALARVGNDAVSRWEFSEEAFKKASKHLNELEPSGIHLVDEIGRLERQGLGHWPVIARQLPQLGGVWLLSIRQGMVASTISRLGYERYTSLSLPASEAEIDEFIEAVLDCAKKETEKQ